MNEFHDIPLEFSRPMSITTTRLQSAVTSAM